MLSHPADSKCDGCVPLNPPTLTHYSHADVQITDQEKIVEMGQIEAATKKHATLKEKLKLFPWGRTRTVREKLVKTIQSECQRVKKIIPHYESRGLDVWVEDANEAIHRAGKAVASGDVGCYARCVAGSAGLRAARMNDPNKNNSRKPGAAC